MHRPPQEIGWIEVVCGPMFSGKTEELIRRVNRARIARQKVQIFKPRIDDRYHAREVVSHSRRSVDSTPVATADEIPACLEEGVQVVAVDEAQFFGPALVPICESLADRGLRVLVAGLDQDYRGAPFDPMPQLLAVAEYVTKQLAICMVCGGPAGRSQRIRGGKGRVEVGAAEAYEARCRGCFRAEGDERRDPERQAELALGTPARARAVVGGTD
jgi:thymidine kinase